MSYHALFTNPSVQLFCEEVDLFTTGGDGAALRAEWLTHFDNWRSVRAGGDVLASDLPFAMSVEGALGS